MTIGSRGRARSCVPTMSSRASPAPHPALRRMLAPLALTQFVASFAGSSMNVSISSISKDIGTTVHGVQTAITLFLLCMAALMIPGSKLTDMLGRKRCLVGGLPYMGPGGRRGGRPALGPPDPRLLGARGHRFGAHDPADLHPRDAVLRRPGVACAGVRRDQRDGRRRRRRGAADRRTNNDHDGWPWIFMIHAAMIPRR